VAAALSVGWVLLGLLFAASLRQLRLLSDRLADPSGATLPALTVVVAARDEEASIEATVRGLLEQRYDDLCVVVVDDRSTDGTGRILDRVATLPEARGRLAVVHNTALPEGWLGKCHACHLGAQRAHGRWILFMDGDVTLARPDLLARVVAGAERDGIDNLSVLPDMGRMPLLQSAMMAAFGQLYLVGVRAWEMDRDLPRGGGGVGAFNLVRRSAYEGIGGHARLRMDPADDIKLGQLLRVAGARQRIVNGYELVLCPWHRGARNAIRGLEKNGFAGLGYSLGVLIALSICAVAMGCGPLIVALAGTLLAPSRGAGLAAATCVPWALQVATLILGWVFSTNRKRAPFASLFLYPVGVALLLFALWNSAVKTLARGGIEWRGTLYPLAELRRGLVVVGRALPTGGAGEPGAGRKRDVQ
jgi:hypothetical protein